MGQPHASRRGSLQFWPRSRAKRQYARIDNYPAAKDAVLLGFAGYKVGMTHVNAIDNRAKSTTKGDEVMWAATILECPPIKIAAVRFYKKTSSYGPRVVAEVRNPKLDKELSRKVDLAKKESKKLADVPADSYDYVRLQVYTQPKRTGIGKKRPELFEVGVGGSKESQLKFAVEHMDKEIPVSSVLKSGQQIDTHAVTKGKGFQGAVKRFGVMIKNHKSEKKIRAPGNLGPWHPAKISFRVPQPGQTGYNTRTVYNARILLISSEVDKINARGGFLRYGVVKNEYIVVKGSVSGPAKRLVRLTPAMRPASNIPTEAPSIEFVSVEPKQ